MKFFISILFFYCVAFSLEGLAKPVPTSQERVGGGLDSRFRGNEGNRGNEGSSKLVESSERDIEEESQSTKESSQQELVPLEEILPPLYTEDEKEGGLSAFWKAVFRTRYLDSPQASDAILSSELYGKLQWDIMDTVSFYAKGLLIARNGFTTSIYERGDRPGSRLHYLEGYFKWSIFSDFFLQLGTIQQSFLNAPLLITDTTFPGVIGGWSVESRYGDFSLLLQSAIPDNADSAIRESQLGGIPLFLTSSLLFESQNLFGQSHIKETFSFFRYYQLSNDVANSSKLYGNTIIGRGEAASFEYDFLGLHSNFSFKGPLSDLWILELGWEYIYNFKAKKFYNEGTRLYSSFYHNYKNFMEIRLKGEVFANQSDTSVSYYNSEIYGHNDRQGVLASIQGHLYKSGLTLETSFVYSQSINKKDGHLGPAYAITFSLMTNYLAI